MEVWDCTAVDAIMTACDETEQRLSSAAQDSYAALRDLVVYLDEHDWGLVPEGATADRARAAIAFFERAHIN